MPESPKIIAETGPERGSEFPIEASEFTMGRESSNAVQVSWDVGVSRQHARILQHLGLLWLEDLGSVNGTFLLAPQRDKRRLAPHQPVLLTHGARFSLGKKARFQVLGTAESYDEALQILTSHMQRLLVEFQAGFDHLPPQEQQRQIGRLRELRNRLRAAQSEEEFFLAARGIHDLSTTMMETRLDPTTASAASPPTTDQGLPPLPQVLPNPEDPNRLQTILNTFFSSLRGFMPETEDQEDDRPH